MPPRTVLQELCDLKLDEPVEGWAQRRYAVLRSWRAVALDLSDTVGHEVSRQTLLNWVRAAAEPDRAERAS
jgi:hypothetical protein